MSKKNIIFILCLLMMATCYKSTKVMAVTLCTYEETAEEDKTEAIPDGLIEKDGCYYYYENGEMVTDRWILSGDKKYYFKKDGEAATGIIVIDEKFYCFGKNGKYNKQKTKKIRKAARYKKPFANLKKFIGKPDKVKYYASCYGNGKDGILSYGNFTIFTFKPVKGAEIFMGAE